MKTISLPYGQRLVDLCLEDSDAVLVPRDVSPTLPPRQTVVSALRNTPDEITRELHAARSVAIAINDKTRPAPHADLLLPLREWLHNHGITDEQITYFIASGSHVPMTRDEIAAMLPVELVTNCKVEAHNAKETDNLNYLSMTTRNTPVYVNRRYLKHDFRISVGDVEPHHFAGYSGGYKTVAIGLAGMQTINANHQWLSHRDSMIAHFRGNPLREDIDEAGRAIGVHLSLNAILNQRHEVIHCLADRPDAVMEKGIELSRAVCSLPVTQNFDIVVASAGGAPKDINFYQAQKALTHASLIAKPGGMLILVAECPEGSGSAAYEEFMQDVDDLAQVFDKFTRLGFKVGPHKAMQVARLASQFSVAVFSSMLPELVSRLLMIPVANLQVFLDKQRESGASVAVLPHATTTIPILQDG